MTKQTIKLQKIDLGSGLYIIATPIGNYKDITVRTLEVLNSVDYVACEDTRTYKKLATHWNLESKKALAYHKHNEASSTKGLLDLLLQKKSIALVSDAGSINISDPGSNIVSACYNNNIKVTSLPGPSSLTTAMSLSPQHKNFCFYGFSDKKSEARKKQLEESMGENLSIFFESCHRINEHLEQANKLFPDRHLLLCKDLSREGFEQVLYKKVQDLCKEYIFKKDKGEYVLIYMPYNVETTSEKTVKEAISFLLDRNINKKDILLLLKKLSNWDRNKIYTAIEDSKND